ncbi:hypothetical protein ACLOJK_007223 [Asimina triloba]
MVCVMVSMSVSMKKLKAASLFTELKRRMSNFHESTSLNEKRASKGVEFERGILEAEYSVVCDKVGQLQEKAKHLEDDIEMLRKEIEEPTEVEIELKKQLGHLTDHLIQKQAQAYSSGLMKSMAATVPQLGSSLLATKAASEGSEIAISVEEDECERNGCQSRGKMGWREGKRKSGKLNLWAKAQGSMRIVHMRLSPRRLVGVAAAIARCLISQL